MEGLEDRKLLATMDSVAYDSLLSLQYTDVVYGNGSLYQFTQGASGVQATELVASGVKSVGIAFNKAGQEVTCIVYSNGAAYQNGVYQGMGVESETPSFNALNQQINSVVYSNGQLYQFDAAGGHYLGNNVVSASLTYDLLGNAVEDVVFNNGNFYEFDSSNSSQHLLASNAVSASTAIGTLYGEVQEVVYSNGDEYQYDQALLDNLLGLGSTLNLGILGPQSIYNGKIFTPAS